MLFDARFNSGFVFFAIVISHSARILGAFATLDPVYVLTQSLMTFGRVIFAIERCAIAN